MSDKELLEKEESLEENVDIVEDTTELEEKKEDVQQETIHQITSSDIDVNEDVAAMLNGETLSEEFVTKATTVFQAAVVSKVNEILESKILDAEAEAEAHKEEIIESFSTKLDSYLEYVTEEWMEENKLAVEQGIVSEIQENFMKGLRDLFAENYIDVPEEKVDLVDELATKVEGLANSVNEEIEKNIELKKDLVEAKAKIVLNKVSSDLTESQAIKLASLSEGVDFSDASIVENDTITSWNWNYGDSNSATTQDNEYFYSTDGTYNVTLIIQTASDQCW